MDPTRQRRHLRAPRHIVRSGAGSWGQKVALLAVSPVSQSPVSTSSPLPRARNYARIRCICMPGHAHATCCGAGKPVCCCVESPHTYVSALSTLVTGGHLRQQVPGCHRPHPRAVSSAAAGGQGVGRWRGRQCLPAPHRAPVLHWGRPGGLCVPAPHPRPTLAHPVWQPRHQRLWHRVGPPCGCGVCAHPAPWALSCGSVCERPCDPTLFPYVHTCVRLVHEHHRPCGFSRRALLGKCPLIRLHCAPPPLLLK